MVVDGVVRIWSWFFIFVRENWRVLFASTSSMFISPFFKLECKLFNSDLNVKSSWLVVYFSSIIVDRHWSIMKRPLSTEDTAFPFRKCYTEFFLYIVSNTLLKPVFSMIVPMAPSKFITMK